MTDDPVSPPLRTDRDRGEIFRLLSFALFIALISGVFGELYAAIFYDQSGRTNQFQGLRTGICIGFFVTVFETIYIRSARRSWIKRLSFLPRLIVRVLVITLIVRISLVGNAFLTSYLTGLPVTVGTDPAVELRDTGISLGLILVFVIVLQISSLIGLKRFRDVLVGRYFRPVKEERIFMFVDLVDSTGMARTLGDVRFHEMLSEYFYQLDRAIVKFGGEIVSYVGDAVIVTWLLHEAPQKNATCLKTLQFMRDRIDQRLPVFEQEFGIRPRFRAALHGGPVVVGECGDSRRQVTFIGDVVNITSRIETACKLENVDFFMSEDLARRLVPPDGVSLIEYGKVPLKGTPAPQNLFRIELSN